jgi:hypothetical protein
MVNMNHQNSNLPIYDSSPGDILSPQAVDPDRCELAPTPLVLAEKLKRKKASFLGTRDERKIEISLKWRFPW